MASKHRQIPAILGVLIALSFFLAAPTACAALNYVKTTVTPNGLADGRFAVNDRGQVAWVGRVDGVDQIFRFSNGANTQITTNTAHSMSIDSLQINNLGQIAWSQYDYDPGGAGLNVNVYLYDGNTYKVLNDNQGQYGWYSQYPHLNNRGEVAWIQSYQQANDGWDVYLYSGNTVQRLTNDNDRQGPPRLNDNGWVTWAGDRRSVNDWDTRVYLYTGALPAPVIAYAAGKGSADPQINNLGQVAWVRYDSSTTPYYNIFVWDVTNTKITNLDATDYTGSYFCLNNNGQILWNWGDGINNQQLYLYGAGGTKKITDDALFYHYAYRLADNGWITWLQNQGQVAGDLYAYRNGSSYRLDTGVAGGGPYLNNLGQVAWGNYYPIFLASPVIATPGINSLLLLN